MLVELAILNQMKLRVFDLYLLLDFLAIKRRHEGPTIFFIVEVQGQLEAKWFCTCNFRSQFAIKEYGNVYDRKIVVILDSELAELELGLYLIIIPRLFFVGVILFQSHHRHRLGPFLDLKVNILDKL